MIYARKLDEPHDFITNIINPFTWLVVCSDVSFC